MTDYATNRKIRKLQVSVDTLRAEVDDLKAAVERMEVLLQVGPNVIKKEAPVVRAGNTDCIPIEERYRPQPNWNRYKPEEIREW